MNWGSDSITGNASKTLKKRVKEMALLKHQDQERNDKQEKTHA
jgi:hypothetical protein